jgi:hypothetical protein
MSSEVGESPAAWRSNGTHPAQRGRGPEPADQENDREASAERSLPTVKERMRGLMDRYPEKMLQPVSASHGRKLREEALHDPEEEVREFAVGQGESETVVETVEREARPLAQVVENMLAWYESYRNKWLRMVKGDGWREGREEFLVDLDNSFQPAYQQQTYARLQALRRQTSGGEYPNGRECSGEFEEPVTVLLGLTASGVEDGEPRPIVDHARGIRNAWSGSSSSVKRTLRYVLEDKFGLDSSEYVWWFQTEPHPGEGANAGYAHAHPVIVLDRAAADVGSVESEDFRAVVAKHVAECPGAEWSAHDLDRSVTVKEPGEIEDFACYVSEYLAVDPDDDLLERSDEYLMYAAANWASTSQKYSKSGTATAAIEVDKCHQRYADPDARQDHDHGEEVVRRDGEIVCWGCGESFGVEQGGTVTERRLAADGGEEREESAEGPPGWNEEKGCFESDDVSVRWAGARSAGSVGGPTVERECDHPEGSAECPLCCPEGVTVDGEVPIPEDAEPAEPVEKTVERKRRSEPRWEPEAIVDSESGEEKLVGSPGGTVFGEVVEKGVGSIQDQLGGRTLLAEWLEGPEPWESGPLSEEEVRSGEVPPPELVEREYAEALHPDRRVTPKEWPTDWYARRFERSGGSGSSEEVPREAIVESVEREPDASVAQVMGRFRISPEHREEVRSVMEGV